VLLEFVSKSVYSHCTSSCEVVYVSKQRICKLHKRLRTALFWVITQRVVVIYYRRFGTRHRSHLSLIRNQCVIQLSILLLLCCPMQGNSIKSGWTLIQELSRRIYRRDSGAKIRSSEMLLHDEWYIVSHLKKKHSAVQIFELECEGVTLIRNVHGCRKNEWQESGAADKHKVLCEDW
jgi:hypothetical protein